VNSKEAHRAKAGQGGPRAKAGLTDDEVEDAEDRARPRAPLIYEVVRREGDEEMDRPIISLWWSGIAAGLSISFSLLAEAILLRFVPDLPWRPLVIALGYPVGFLMVILAHQQLFTETTITAVLPLVAEPTPRNLGRLSRMWAVVFAANMIGTLFAALFCSLTPVLSPELRGAMIEISGHVLDGGWITLFFKGISAGFLIAALVWLLPAAEATQFHIITMLTYLIGVGGFAHIVAGSVEAFMLVIDGRLGVGTMLLSFTIPVLLGNIVGGTALFALIAYAQVMKEV
jgi:formate/nitrite transporter FocA (FNT family)